MNEQEKKELADLKAKEIKTDIDNNRIKELEAKESKQYTQEEINALLQSETDKRVTNALKTAQEKWNTEFETKLEQEKKEAERLATLSAEEKSKEEIKKQCELLEQKEKELRNKELKFDTINLLSQEKLPLQFADMLIAQDAETTNTNIKAFKETYAKAIEEAVKERLAGKTPNSSGGGTLNKELKEMTSFERIELKKNNLVLYKQLLEKRDL